MPSNTYYGRLRVGGKLIRRSRRTTAFTTAKLRLADFERQQRVAPPRASDAPASFRDARRAYEQELLCRHDLKPRTREYRLGCIKVLLKTWPGLDLKRLTQISTADCQTWAARFAAEYDAHYFNQVLSTLRRILQLGGLHSNPALAVKRRGVKPRQLFLPEPGQFQALLAEMERAGGRDSRTCADFVRFLAYSGCRLSEARQVLWRVSIFTEKVILMFAEGGRGWAGRGGLEARGGVWRRRAPWGTAVPQTPWDLSL